MQTSFKYPLGAVAKDKISGFTGIIVIRGAHLFGCAQYAIAPQELNSDGTTKRSEYFDESRIEILSNNLPTEGKNSATVCWNLLTGDKNSIDEIFLIPLGTEVVDKVSGFKGKVLIAYENLHNCNQYYVEPPVDEKGKEQDGHFYDEGRLDIIGVGIKPEDVASKKRGSVFSRDLHL